MRRAAPYFQRVVGEFSRELSLQHELFGRSEHYFKLEHRLRVSGIHTKVAERAQTPLTSTYLPAVWTRSACDKALDKFFHHHEIVRPHATAEAVAWALVEEELMPCLNHRILTHEEALCAISKNTSCGPFISYNNKREAVDDPSFQAELQAAWEETQNTIGVKTFSGCALKEETRDRERVLLEKTRPFMSADIFSTYFGARLTYDYASRIYRRRDSPIKAGTDMFHGTPNRWFESMSCREKIAVTDASSFDASISEYFFRRLLHLKWSTLRPADRTPENWRSYLNYYSDCAFGVLVLPRGEIVMSTGGMQSGKFITLIDNCVVTLFLAMYHLMKRNPGLMHSRSPRHELRKELDMWIMGDDCTVAFNRYFDPTTYAEDCADFNIVMQVETPPLKDVSFISHTFFQSPYTHGYAFTLASPSVDKVLSSLIYSDKNRDNVNHYLERLGGVMSVLYPHQEVFFELQTLLRTVQSMYPNADYSPVPSDQELYYLHHCLENDFASKKQIVLKSPMITLQSMNTPAAKPRAPRAAAKKSNVPRNKPTARDVAMAVAQRDRAQTDLEKMRVRNKFSKQMAGSFKSMESSVGSVIAAAQSCDQKLITTAACSYASPGSVMARLPDGYKHPTALVHSRQVIDIPVSQDGKWSVCCQPKLGSVAGVTNYKTAIVVPDPTTNKFPTTFNASTSFMSTSASGDPRVDPNTAYLTQPPAMYWEIIAVGGWTGTESFHDGFYTPSLLNHGVGPIINTQLSDANAYNQVILSGGSYIVTYSLTRKSGLAWPHDFAICPLQVDTTDGCQPAAVVIIADPLSGYSTSLGPDLIIETLTWQAVIAVGDDSYGSFKINNLYGILGYNTGNTSSVTMTVAPIGSATTQVTNEGGNLQQAVSSLNSGVVQQVRPVAMSMLVTYMGPTLTDGGHIAAAQVQGSTVNTQYFTNANNSLANFANLANYQGAQNWDLRKGCYVYWLPESNSDINFLKPSDANTKQYPALIASGTYQPGSDIPTVALGLIRVQVDTVYEFTTTSQAYTLQQVDGSQTAIETVWKLVSNHVPRVMENPQHGARIVSFFKKVGMGVKKTLGFYNQNKQWIDPALGALIP